MVKVTRIDQIEKLVRSNKKNREEEMNTILTQQRIRMLR